MNSKSDNKSDNGGKLRITDFIPTEAFLAQLTEEEKDRYFDQYKIQDYTNTSRMMEAAIWIAFITVLIVCLIVLSIAFYIT